MTMFKMFLLLLLLLLLQLPLWRLLMLLLLLLPSAVYVNAKFETFSLLLSFSLSLSFSVSPHSNADSVGAFKCPSIGIVNRVRARRVRVPQHRLRRRLRLWLLRLLTKCGGRVTIKLSSAAFDIDAWQVSNVLPLLLPPLLLLLFLLWLFCLCSWCCLVACSAARHLSGS